MSQKLLLNRMEFEKLPKIKEEVIILLQKNLYNRYYYGRNTLLSKDNIKSLKNFEKRITKFLIKSILNTSEITQIVGDKLYIKENIEQEELDYQLPPYNGGGDF